MSTFKKILRGIIDVFAASILVFALLTSSFTSGISDAETSAETVCDDEFYEVLENDIVTAMNAFGGVIDIQGTEVLEAVGKDNVKQYAKNYTVTFFEAVHSGKEFAPPKFDDGNLKDYIFNYIRGFEPDISEENLQEIYDVVHKSVVNSLQYIPGLVLNVIPTAGRIFSSLSFLGNIEIFLYLLFIVLVAINVVLSEKKKYFDTFYGLLGTIFCVLAAVFIPLLMITLYDIPSKLVLDAPVLLKLIGGVNDLVFEYTALITGIAFIIATLALITVSVFIARKKSQNKLEKTVDKN